MRTDEELINNPGPWLTSEELQRRRALIAKEMERHRQREWTAEDDAEMDLLLAYIEADGATKH